MLLGGVAVVTGAGVTDIAGLFDIEQLRVQLFRTYLLFSTVLMSNSTVCVLKIRQFKTVEYLYSTVFLSKIKALDVENQMFGNVELRKFSVRRRRKI